MELGLIGLGNMGGNITRRLMRAGHRCVVFDTKAETREALAKEGASAADSLESLVAGLKQKPRAVWVMLPAGKITEETVNRLAALMQPGDIIIDGGNSYYKDDLRRAKELANKGIRYVDCGTSGGVWGLDRGYCMMIGGEKAAVEHLDPIWSDLAPGIGDVARTLGASVSKMYGTRQTARVKPEIDRPPSRGRPGSPSRTRPLPRQPFASLTADMELVPLRENT